MPAVSTSRTSLLLALAAALPLASCDRAGSGASDAGRDASAATDQAAPADLAAPRDLAPGADLAAAPDLAAADLAAPADLRLPDDLARPADLASLRRCSRDDECRLFSSQCDGCECLALAASEPDPVCQGMMVLCFVDPCERKSVRCDNASQRCIVVGG